MDALEESLRAFHTGLSRSEAIEPVSGFFFVPPVGAALEAGNAAALEAAVLGALRNEQYIG